MNRDGEIMTSEKVVRACIKEDKAWIVVLAVGLDHRLVPERRRC